MIDGKEKRPETQILATQEYTKNPDSPVGQWRRQGGGARGAMGKKKFPE